MGKILRRVLDGYVTLSEWSPSDPATVKAAEEIFRREVEGGCMAVVEDDGMHSSGPVRSLPVDAERVVMTMPMGGGSAAEPSARSERSRDAATTVCRDEPLRFTPV